jgi:hypothetical protein
LSAKSSRTVGKLDNNHVYHGKEEVRLGAPIMEGLNDPRWLGRTKMQYIVKSQNGVQAVVHYVAKWEDGVLKAVDDFKFK